MALIAAELATKSIAGAEPKASTDFQDIVDPASGLTLPLPLPPLKYEERPVDEFGRRATIEEWLTNDFWLRFSSQKLISAGELKSVDLSAYKALNRRAEMLAKNQSGKSPSEVRTSYFLQNGVLSEDLLKSPPEELGKQVLLLLKAQAIRKYRKARERSSR